MLNFKKFLQDNMEEEKEDIQKTLSKLPKAHSDLVRGYKWKFHAGNTLNGDDKHVGYMDKYSKEIAIAAPWNFSREFTILHEIAHLVYERLSKEIKNQWSSVVKKNFEKQTQENPEAKDSLKQIPEEIFCHCYANFYSKHKNATYNNPEWMGFIRTLHNAI